MRKLAILTGAACIVTLVLTGCATMKGPTDEELVMQQTQAFVNDLLAGNADKILDYVSADFSHEKVPTKEKLAEHIKKAKESGRAAEIPNLIKEHNGQIDLKDAKVTIEKDIATVYPVAASANEGAVTAEIKFKKDPDKVWRIVGLNIEGI